MSVNKSDFAMGITYDFIAEDLRDSVSPEEYVKQLHVKLLIAETALDEAVKETDKAKELIVDMLEIIAEFRKLTHPKAQPTMTAYDLGWTPTGTI